MTHRTETPSPTVNWTIVRRVLYVLAAIGIQALSRTGIIDADTADTLASDVTELTMTGLFFLAAWHAK